jgi:hypothetical protein
MAAEVTAGQLKEIAANLREAPRQGADMDVPEGSRFLIVSDTLANQLADILDAVSTNVGR